MAEILLERGLCLTILVPAVADRRLSNTFNQSECVFAFLLAYRVAKDAPQEADVIAKLGISDVVGLLTSHGFGIYGGDAAGRVSGHATPLDC